MSVVLSSGFAPACPHETGCITCGDVAAAMVVVEADREPGLARCAAEDGAEELVETDLSRPGSAGRPPPRTRRHGHSALDRERARVKYVDEYATPSSAALAAQVHALAEPGRRCSARCGVAPADSSAGQTTYRPV